MGEGEGVVYEEQCAIQGVDGFGWESRAARNHPAKYAGWRGGGCATSAR